MNRSFDRSIGTRLYDNHSKGGGLKPLIVMSMCVLGSVFRHAIFDFGIYKNKSG